jgi:acetate kinase
MGHGLTALIEITLDHQGTEQQQAFEARAVLDGADAIVFTGGIGENDAVVRTEICDGLSSLGVRLDTARHHAMTNPISSAGARCAVHVLPSLEDEQIARHTAALIGTV